MSSRKWKLVLNGSSLITKIALAMGLCSDVINTEKSITR